MSAPLWTDEELRISLALYKAVLAGIISRHQAEELWTLLLPGRRSPNRRMGNISWVLQQDGKPYIEGRWGPCFRVGPNVAARIRKMLTGP